jgi:hypothetical protein
MKKQWRPPSKKRNKPKPEEYEGMPQHQHCPPAKRHGDRNPKYMKGSKKTLHELSPHIPPKTPKRNISSSTKEILHMDMAKNEGQQHPSQPSDELPPK